MVKVSCLIELKKLRNVIQIAEQVKINFQIYIPYEVISSFFTLPSSLISVHAANDNFTVHKIMSSINITDLFPVFLIAFVTFDVSSH
jgi:hypothetical protein